MLFERMAFPTNRNLDQIPGWHGWRPFVGCRGHRVFCASGSANLSRSHAKSTWTNLRHTLLRCSFVALVTTSTCRSCRLTCSESLLLTFCRWEDGTWYFWRFYHNKARVQVLICCVELQIRCDCSHDTFPVACWLWLCPHWCNKIIQNSPGGFAHANFQDGIHQLSFVRANAVQPARGWRRAEHVYFRLV